MFVLFILTIECYYIFKDVHQFFKVQTPVRHTTFINIKVHIQGMSFQILIYTHFLNLK